MDEHVYEDEIELMDYLNVLWKRKWLIIVPTFFVVIAAGIVSFLLPPAWKVDAIIVPSKFLIQTAQGEIEEIVVVPPEQIASQINEESYNNLIAAELKLDIEEFPELEAENIKGTKLIQISLKENDVEKGKRILHSLFNHLKSDLDKKASVEIKGIDTQIESKRNAIKQKEIQIKDNENAIKLKKLLIKDRKNEIKTKQNAIKLKNLNIASKEIEKKKLEGKINTLTNKRVISEERVVAITQEMKEVKNRIDKIENEQREVLKGGNPKDAVGLLLYSNEIQNNLRYYNTLDEKLSNEKLTQENINLSIGEKKETIKQIDNQIEQIRTQIDDIHTQIDNVKNEIGKINNEIDTIRNAITIKNNEIENVRNEITYLEKRKKRIDYAQLVKAPTASIYPVFPKKKLNVLIAGVLGVMIFTMLAFFLEYVEKHKKHTGVKPPNSDFR